ncbi:retrovirus-related pol polyprotein from transposon TNT 1-94 [Tanacetum coccineum]
MDKRCTPSLNDRGNPSNPLQNKNDKIATDPENFMSHHHKNCKRELNSKKHCSVASLGRLSGFFVADAAITSLFQFISMDCENTVILNGPLEGEVYVAQPDGFVIQIIPTVYRLRKTLIWMKQAPRDPDVNHAGCIDTRKSTSGGIQFLGCAQVMWMRTQLQDYGFNYNKIPLYYATLLTIASIMQTPWCSTPKQTYPYSLSLQKEQPFPEKGFIISSDNWIGDEMCIRKKPTKIELTLEQSQQGVSNDVLIADIEVRHHGPSDALHNHSQPFKTFRVKLLSIHNDQWKSFQCHHQTAHGYINMDIGGDASFQLKSDSFTHAHHNYKDIQ